MPQLPSPPTLPAPELSPPAPPNPSPADATVTTGAADRPGWPLNKLAAGDLDFFGAVIETMPPLKLIKPPPAPLPPLPAAPPLFASP